MQFLVGPFYAVFMLGVIFTSFFIVFHLANYSVNRRVARFTIFIFCIGTAVLIFTNVSLFFSVPFDEIASALPAFIGTSGNSSGF